LSSKELRTSISALLISLLKDALRQHRDGFVAGERRVCLKNQTVTVTSGEEKLFFAFSPFVHHATE